MLYFPLVAGHWPTWMPVVGGDYFIFFQPIFNIADSAISIGVFLALINYRSLNKELESFQQTEPAISTNTQITSNTVDTLQEEE